MSRSYRKPYVTDGYKGSGRRQFFKRYSNKIIRKTDEIPSGKSFKKFTDGYSICDYRWRDSPEKWDKPWKLIRK